MRGGEAPLSGTGFIDHYLENVVYPERYTHAVQTMAAMLVLFSWVVFAARRWRSRRSRRGRHARAVPTGRRP